MKRQFKAAAIMLLLASCGGGTDYTAPRDLENACAIVRERPKYLHAMQRSESRWGVPVAVQMAMIHQESKFVGNARTPFRYTLGVIPMGRQTSAYGYSQAIDDTWNDYREATGRRGAKRDRIEDATDFMGWYIDGTSRGIGIPKTDARDQYLAYHEGRRGFVTGSHNGKSWLLGVASQVEERAIRYDVQLRSCGKA